MERNKQQEIQLRLSFGRQGQGESRSSTHQGSELRSAAVHGESPAITEQLIEKVVLPENWDKALKKVRANRGSPGIDGMTVVELPDYLAKHGYLLREQLLNGTYKPHPVKRVEIEKPDGGVRKLGIPTVVDRFVQQMLLNVLQSLWDPTFSPYSFGFRPGKSQQMAVAQAQQYLLDGYAWVVDIDMEKFFDRVNHDKLMGKLAERIQDKRVLKLIRRFLTAGVLEGGLVSPAVEGTPQGGPLSPLLSNIVLDELDQELSRRGHRFVRYADDSNIYVRTQRAGERVMGSLKRFITTRLKLKVNESKSAVARPHERKFLGFTFTSEEQPRRTIADKSLERCKAKIREITRKKRGRSLEAVLAELRSYLTGWLSYYRSTEVQTPLNVLGGWTRRRLRSLAWRQWKTSTRRREALTKLDVGEKLARQTAGSPKGTWRIAHSKALQIALSNVRLESMGLPSFEAVNA
jgi:RNA-directed DNA polymerase